MVKPRIQRPQEPSKVAEKRHQRPGKKKTTEMAKPQILWPQKPGKASEEAIKTRGSESSTVFKDE